MSLTRTYIVQTTVAFSEYENVIAGCSSGHYRNKEGIVWYRRRNGGKTMKPFKHSRQ